MAANPSCEKLEMADWDLRKLPLGDEMVNLLGTFLDTDDQTKGWQMFATFLGIGEYNQKVIAKGSQHDSKSPTEYVIITYTTMSPNPTWGTVYRALGFMDHQDAMDALMKHAEKQPYYAEASGDVEVRKDRTPKNLGRKLQENSLSVDCTEAIAKVLTPKHPVGSDWKLLARKLVELDDEKIMRLEQGKHDPTSKLLIFYQFDESATLGQLYECFQKMGRFDVIDILWEHNELKESEPGDEDEESLFSLLMKDGDVQELIRERGELRKMAESFDHLIVFLDCLADFLGMEVDTVRPGYDARPTTINIHGGHVQMGLVNQMKEVLRKYGPPPAGPPNIDLHIVRSESYRMERVEEDIGSREEKIRKLVDMGFPEENAMRVVRGFPKLRIEELINRLVKMQSSKTDGHTLRQPQKPQKPDKPGIMRGQGDGSEEGEEIVPGMKYLDDYPISSTVESPESKHRVGFDVDQPCKGPVASGAPKILPRYHGKDDLHGEMKIGEKDKTTIISRGIADKTTLKEDHVEDTDGRMTGSPSDSHSSEPRPLGAPGVELDRLKAPPCKLSSENLLKVTETSPSPSMTSEDSAVGSSLKSDDLRSDCVENIEKVASSCRDRDVKICREHLQRGAEDDTICEVETPPVDTESGAYLLSSEQIEVVTNKRATLISNDGAFGPVYKGIFPYSGPHKREKVAVKVLDKSGDHGSSEYNREKTVATVKHPNILPVFAVCEEDGCIVYPYMENRDLSYQLKAKNQELTWQKRLVIAIGIGKAIACLHTPTELRPSKIFHRDIKSANILLDDKWWPYLGDTGLTREIPKEKMYKSRTGFQTFLCGTLGYSDPSLVNKPPGYYDAASDVYSYGKVLLELLTGVLASETADDDSGDFVHNQWEDEGFFEDVTGTDLVKQADTSSHVAWPETVKEEFAKIIVSCLKRNRKKRQKLDVICKKLEELRMEHRVTLFCSTNSEKCFMCLTNPLSDETLACGCRTVCSTCIDNRRRNYLACPEHGNVQPSDD